MKGIYSCNDTLGDLRWEPNWISFSFTFSAMTGYYLIEIIGLGCPVQQIIFRLSFYTFMYTRHVTKPAIKCGAQGALSHMK